METEFDAEDAGQPRLGSSLPADLDTYLETYIGAKEAEVEEDLHHGETAFGSYPADQPLAKKLPENTEETPLLKDRRRTVSFAAEPNVVFQRTAGLSERFTNSLTRAKLNMAQNLKFLGKSGSLLLFQRSMVLTMSLVDVESMDRKAGNFLTSMNILCLIQGISIFAMPFVTVYGGLAVIFSTFIIGFLNWYATYLINECQHQLSRSDPGLLKRVYPTYIEIGRAVFPRYGGTLMKLATLMTMVSGISFFILLGQTTFDLLSAFTPLARQHWIIIWAIIVFPCLFVTRVSVMAWFSLAALLSLTVVIGAAYVLLIANYRTWSISNISGGFSLEFLMLGYGIIHNSYFLHLAVPAIEGSMKEPSHCNKSMAIAFSINTLLKVAFQVLGALTFGTLINQSVTTNLSLTLGISFLINILTAVNLYCSFPISLCVMFEMLDEYLLPHFTIFEKQKRSFYGWLIMSRGIILLFVVFISVSIPQFGLVVSFLGNIRSTFLALILPLYFHLHLKWRHISLFTKVFNIFLIVFASIVGVGAAYYSVRAIIIKLS